MQSGFHEAIPMQTIIYTLVIRLMVRSAAINITFVAQQAEMWVETITSSLQWIVLPSPGLGWRSPLETPKHILMVLRGVPQDLQSECFHYGLPHYFSFIEDHSKSLATVDHKNSLESVRCRKALARGGHRMLLGHCNPWGRRLRSPPWTMWGGNLRGTTIFFSSVTANAKQYLHKVVKMEKFSSKKDVVIVIMINVLWVKLM